MSTKTNISFYIYGVRNRVQDIPMEILTLAMLRHPHLFLNNIDVLYQTMEELLSILRKVDMLSFNLPEIDFRAISAGKLHQWFSVLRNRFQICEKTDEGYIPLSVSAIQPSRTNLKKAAIDLRLARSSKAWTTKSVILPPCDEDTVYWKQRSF